jgi:hypothetical protein
VHKLSGVKSKDVKKSISEKQIEEHLAKVCDSFCVLGQFCGYITMEVKGYIIRKYDERQRPLATREGRY